MTRLVIDLEPNERRALEILAAREMRDVRKQATLIIRQRLEQLDLLIVPDGTEGTQEPDHD